MRNIRLTISEKKAIKELSLNINPSGIITYSTLQPVMKTQENIKISHGKMELESIKNGKRRFYSQYIEMFRYLEKLQIVESPATLEQIYEMLETPSKQNAFISLMAKGIITENYKRYKITDLSLLAPVEPYIYINIVQNYDLLDI